MRVLAVMPGITPDAGAEQSLAAVAPWLAAEGVELHLALLTDRQALAPAIVAAGGVVHDLSAVSGAGARARALRALIRRIHPDVVHATLYEATLPSQLAVVGTGVPVLVTWASTTYSAQHIAVSNAASWKVRIVQLSEIVLARLARTSFHAVTTGVGRVNSTNLRVPPSRVLVGERGRDPQRFEPDADAVESITAELNPSGDHRFVLAVGRQDRQKGYPLLLDEFDRLADSHPDVELLIAGRAGVATPDLQSQQARLRHGDRVRFLGHRDDTPALMQFADVVVCSSVIEGAAGALIEAMACAVPIVSVPLDGLEDVLTDGENALVSQRDRLGEALGRALDDPILAARIGAGGRATFEERFTIEKSGRRLAEIYRTVAGRGGPADREPAGQTRSPQHG